LTLSSYKKCSESSVAEWFNYDFVRFVLMLEAWVLVPVLEPHALENTARNMC